MKKWFESKLVWLGILQVLIGSLQLVYELLVRGGPITPADVILLVTGILTIILRVFFTDTTIRR